MRQPEKRTRRNALDQALANGLRSQVSMNAGIRTIHRAIMSMQSEIVTQLPPQIVESAFKISATDFGTALNFDNENLVQIEKISRQNSAVVELNYLKMATSYILANPERVNAWISLDAQASALALEGKADEIVTKLVALPPADQQALASLKLYAGLHAYSDDIIREYLNRNLPSHWTQNRLLYPLVFYFINLPDSAALDNLLMQVFPSKGTGPAERLLTKFLLLPDRPETANLALRSYVALLSHPYDALEYITTDLERRCATGEPFSRDYLAQYEKLALCYPEHRLSRLVSLAQKRELEFARSTDAIFGIKLADDSRELSIINNILDLSLSEKPKNEELSEILSAIVDARWSKYPDPNKFDDISTYHRRFAVLTSARLVRYIYTSLYLFSREDPVSEALNILDGILLTGQLSPFTCSGPQGYSLMLAERFPCEVSGRTAIRQTAAILDSLPEGVENRAWIKKANWAQAIPQEDGRASEWVDLAARQFPVWITPRYLSGLDWHWLDAYIAKMGMRALTGRVSAIHVLFLKQMEEFRRESVPLRLAIEPVTRKNPSFEQFRSWLKDNLGKDSLAFVRYFLNSDTILKLRLSDNYTSAASYRLDLLVSLVREMDFQEGVFAEADLEGEQDILTAMLCRMSVGAQQFEIGWDTIKEVAVRRTSDAYSAYEAVSHAVPEDAIANTKRTSPYQFANGANGDYEARNRDWPLVLIIGGMIDAFLAHPAAGIEAILSVRIRHDNFRREYATAIQQIEAGSIAGIPSVQMRAEVSKYGPPIYREIQRWLDNRMHTSRKDKPQALFNFIPTKAEMNDLIAGATGMDHRQIGDSVFEWIKPRLELHLERAREMLSSELGTALEKRVHTTRTELAQQRGDPADHRRVGDAVAAAVKRRTHELDEWFKVPEHDRDQSLSIFEVTNAVQQRFHVNRTTGHLIWRSIPASLATRIVAPQNIRHLYDLLSEVAHNAVKYGRGDSTTLYTSIASNADGDFVVFSNIADQVNCASESITGHPYKSLHETLFGEGNSGIKKIAYISASIMGRQTEIFSTQRGRYFHLAVPMYALGGKS